MRVGGPADLLAIALGGEALRQAVGLAWAHGVPCQVLGSGSNILVGDAGIRGVVVLNRARAMHVTRAMAWAESGASFSALARRCVVRGLAGLEWASGIPGTVGGAVAGNAGAWGGDVASTLVKATMLEADGCITIWPAARFEYGYRTSILKRQTARPAVVLEAEFTVRKGNREELQARVAEISARRRASQPRGPSCGSVFRNPPDDYAGRLIEAAGLKGLESGRAQISPKHANFIVNLGGATAADVKALMDLARQRVWEQSGVTLEPEVELLGEW
ncbi:MAG: UDP-N-acetylmuramate dehydrogenase [Anaerolineae bacterium]|nr:UDP-N-acetylmuramate dehydrogenase [Anaerolineae bacterium]